MAEPATNSPQLVISYHVHDEKWRNRLVTHLDLAVEEFLVVDDRQTQDFTFVKFFEEFRERFRRAKVVLFLISPEYVTSSWIMTDQGRDLLEELAGQGVARICVNVEEVPTQTYRRLQARSLEPFNATPLGNTSVERQNLVLSLVAREVVKAVEHGPEPQQTTAVPDVDKSIADDLTRFAKSNQVENALRRARRLAAASSPPAITTAALLFGLAEGGRTAVDYFRTPQFLWDELTAGGDFLYTRMLTEEFAALAARSEEASPPLDLITEEVDLVTNNVVKVFELAEEVARRTAPERSQHGPPEIGARHLLAALLALDPDDGPTGARRRLATIVGDVTAMRKRFYNFIVKTVRDDNHQAWRAILTNLKLPETQPPEPKQAEPQRKQNSATHRRWIHG